MLEKIYTIPVNEAFDACRDDASCGCPVCVLRKKLEAERVHGSADHAAYLEKIITEAEEIINGTETDG